MKKSCAAFAVLVIVATSAMTGAVSCGTGDNTLTPIETTPEVAAFREAAVELQKREPDDVDRVTVQYIQIPQNILGHAEHKPKRSIEEAEAHAAALFKQAKEGAEFDHLVHVNSYGSLSPGQRPGVSIFVEGDVPEGSGPITFSREATDDVDLCNAAWRLKPGEIGAVEWHRDNNPGGFYVMRRLTDEQIKQDNPANFPAANEQIAKLREDAASLMEREEHDAERVKVQHFVIARYMSAPDGRHKILQPEEAEAKAAELYVKVLEGADFTATVEANTYDALQGNPTGAYELVVNDSELKGPKRKGMIPAFGDAAWRLEVGEVGVVLYDQARSWYGYHIIKRLE